MKLKVQNINLSGNYRNNVNNGSKDVNFCGIGAILSDFSDKLTKSASHFSNYSIRKTKLDTLFGDEFTKMEDELRGLSSKVFDFEKRIVFDNKGGVTFVEDGIVPKFLKSALYPFKNMWLDIACWALNGMSEFKKVPAVSEFGSRALKSDILSNRMNSVNAEDLFCIMQGAFSDIAKNEKTANKVKDDLSRHIIEKGFKRPPVTTCDTPQIILDNLIHAASNVKGNYKTADERTINRICTGMVSATMAGIDFYNISRMQNDDDALAKKSQKKRFKQESSRILMSAGMTFLTLGALSKYANANKYFALFTIAGTTLVSEILSRLLNGMPLRPLKPDEAKDFAYHKHEKEAKKQHNEQTQNKGQSLLVEELPSVYNSFAKYLSVNEKSKETKFMGSDTNEVKSENSLLSIKNIAIAAVVCLFAGLGVSFARCRNAKFNNFLKSVFDGMNDGYNMLTKRDFLVPSENIKVMLEHIKNKYGMREYADKFYDAIYNDDQYTEIIKNINGKDVAFIKLGKVDKKVIAPLIKAITYPFGFLWGAIRLPVKTLQAAFVQGSSDESSKIVSQDIIGLYKVFDKAMKKLKSKEITNEEFDNFIKRKVLIAVENKTGKSAYKNSSLAAISRPFVTLIASYFFVNDYRNEVLITSQGKDVEGANAVAKERVMHKVSNFFFNSLLMNLFNSVFESAYHGSLIGAGAVAAATEFTNENLIRKSIGVPTHKMTRAQIEEHDRQNLERDDFWGKYFRFMSKLTGKKTISQKAQDEQKKKAKKA